MAETRATERHDGDGAVYGALAEFSGPDTLMLACRRMRDEGFDHWDAHSPFPIHGLERAMGLKRSPVSIFVLVLGLGGAGVGMLLQWWVSTAAYPLVVSGKPFFSWQAFVPIMFECGVLGGALGALFGFLFMARLPRHHHPLFESEAFERVGDDAFYISVEARDERFDRSATLDLLADLGASRVELVHMPGSAAEPVTAGGRA